MLRIASKFLTGGAGSTPPPPTQTTPPATVPPVTAPPPAAGSLRATTTAVAYPPLVRALGSSKHLDFARLGSRWFLMCGDHAAVTKKQPITLTPPYTNDPQDAQDGRQEIVSVDFAANDWRLETPYYLPAGVQQAFPDDAFTIARKGEAFVLSGNTAHRLPPFQPVGMAIQLWGRLTAFDPLTKTYRDVAPLVKETTGNRAWRGCYDAKLDRFVVPCRVNELVWVLIDAKTGADLTYRYPSGNPKEWGAYRIHAAGIVGDPASRTRYVYEHYRHEVYAVDLDSFAMTLLATLPEPATVQGGAMQIVWHPGKRCVVVGHTKLHAFEVDSARLTTWDRADGFTNKAGVYVPPSTMLYDDATGDVVSIGGIDWDGMIAPSYWRTRID